MAAPDGTQYPMEGEYDAVDRPHRISYAARPLAPDGTALFELMITGSFEAEDDKTRITVDAAVLAEGPGRRVVPRRAPARLGAEPRQARPAARRSLTHASPGGPGTTT